MSGVLLIKKRILWIREIRPVLRMAILNKDKSSKCLHRYLLLKHKTISGKWTHIILKWTWNESNHQLLRFAFSHIYLDDDDALKPVGAHGSLNSAGRGRCVAAGCSSWLFKFRVSRMMRCSWLQLVALFKICGSRTMRCRRLQFVALYISRVMDRSRQTYIIAIEQYI